MRLSIKMRVTLWFTALMIILSAVVIFFMFSAGRHLIEDFSRERLKKVVREAIDEVEFDNGKLEYDDDIADFIDGVYLFIYDKDFNKIFGMTSPDFYHQTPFVSGKFQKTEFNKDNLWYVYDLSQDIPEAGTIWVRGIISAAWTDTTFGTLSKLAFLSMPFLIIMAAIGGYFITKGAFRPVKMIRTAAEHIEEGRDLSQRINLGKGDDEIYTLASTFDKMFDRLQTSFENEKQFTSDASHELRTPVSVIISQCEYAIENTDTVEEGKEALAKILKQAKKMSALISQLLTLARADKGQQKLNMELVNISELAEVVSTQQNETANMLDMEVKTKIVPELFIYGDETMLMRLFINLISNGISYGKPKGEVLVEVFKQDDDIVCRISDNGIGIASEYIDKVWERFFQADPSRSSAAGGNGLGLSMVKWIAEAHGGHVSLESVLGKGSIFTVFFPIKK